MSLAELRAMELEALVDHVKTGGRREVLQAWKQARADGDDHLSDVFRYALNGGERPEEQESTYQQRDVLDKALDKAIAAYRSVITPRKPSTIMAYA